MPVRSRHQIIKRAPRSSRTTPDGQVFDSLGEMRRYQELLEEQRKGQIRALTRQVSFELYLADGSTPVLTPTGRTRRYTPDFVYEEPKVTSHGFPSTWETVYEEYKGVDDPTSELRRSVFEARYGKVRMTGPAKKPKARKRAKAVTP